jgi:hypothetical protein
MGVSVRQKGKKLYLDIYWNGKRTWEALKISITGNSAEDKEARRLAEIIRQKRELTLVSGEHGLVDAIGAKQTLLEYTKKQAAGRGTDDHVYRLVKYLEGYNGNIQLQAINSQWVDGFKKYLLSCPIPNRKDKKIISRRTASHMYKALDNMKCLP